VFGDSGMDFGGVLWDPVIYGGFGLWIVWYVLWVSLAATVAASIYPIWFATRVNPAEALRVA
jgi:ABC-type antimicrobial peptide transport system permease subunit